VTRGRLPQRAGSPCLNGSWTAAAVPPEAQEQKYMFHFKILIKTVSILVVHFKNLVYILFDTFQYYRIRNLALRNLAFSYP